MYRRKRPQGWAAKVRLKWPANPQGKSVAVIPEGNLCYGDVRWAEPGKRTADGAEIVLYTKLCPYWSAQRQRPDEQHGYCALVSRGDWMTGTGMLWDQVKECGYNTTRMSNLPDRFAYRRWWETRRMGNLPLPVNDRS